MTKNVLYELCKTRLDKVKPDKTTGKPRHATVQSGKPSCTESVKFL